VLKDVKGINELLKEFRQGTDRYYYQVAYFCGGSIVLSITFLGYLISAKVFTGQFLWILYTAWGLLLIGLLCAIFRNRSYWAAVYYDAISDTTSDSETANNLRKRKKRWGNLGWGLERIADISLVLGLIALIFFAALTICKFFKSN